VTTPPHALGSAATPEQRDALASPLRLEIFGHFLPAEPLSVRELAQRMGRSPHSLYYHVHALRDVGLLAEAGERPGATRPEALYAPAVSAVRLEPDGSAATRDAIRRTMAVGFRMAERDLEAALAPGAASAPGVDGLALLATRLHFRATREEIEEVRDHLSAAVAAIQRLAGRPPTDGAHYSLTLALLPLRGRERPEETP
jgi:DNA-binding transcriptional ArsR family regulator